MATTTNYSMTLLEQAQAQKEVTINEAIGVIDAVLKGTVIDKDLATPPGSPAQGDAYIVAASPTGAWSGKVKHVAYYDQVWRFIAPFSGMRVWVSDEQCYYQYSGSAWATSNPAITGNAATATALQTARTINGVAFDGTANITITASAGNLTGEVTSVGLATTVTNSAVIGKVITGYTSGAGTVAATDTILQAIQKLNGNTALRAPIASPTFTGTVSGITAAMVGAPSGSGSVSGTNTGDQTITLTGDVTGSGTGSFAASIGSNKVTNSMLAQVATGVFKGRTTAGTGNVEDLSATQATALLNAMVGDTGSGGTKGLVPAPAAGDAAKFLTGAGTYVAAGGSGTVTSFSVTPSNGVSASVSTATTTPVLSVGLGNITPTSVAASGTVTGSNLSGTNTGDQTNISGNAATATALQTARTINGVSFDGTANITISASAAANLLTGATLASGVVTSSLTAVGTLATGTWNATAIGAAYGGTGQTSYTTGDLLYASGSTALSKLAGVATGNALISGGTSTAPSWGKVGLTTHVSGTLPVANGGSGVTTSTGSGNNVLSTSPTLVTPVLGTPASGTLTNCTGLPVSTGISGLGTGVGTFLATPSSANLASAVTDETGSGALVFASSPTLAGTPLAPTASAGTNTTQIATTAFALANNFTLSTVQASTSGTAIDFTGIPATAKYIVIHFNGVSTSGNNAWLVQLGKSAGFETTGYSSGSTYLQGSAPYASPSGSTSGLIISVVNSAVAADGQLVLALMDASNNRWSSTHALSGASGSYVFSGSGCKALAGTLDRVRITTSGGTDTFDAGSINISWS